MLFLVMLLSVLISAITATSITIKIAAAVKRELMKYVEEMCEINIEQSQKIKDCAMKNVEILVRKISQNKPE